MKTHFQFQVLAQVFFLAGMFSCAHQPSTPNGLNSQFYDSALNDKNRAPASLQPPPKSADFSQTLDPVAMRAQGDFYFAMGEAYSYEGFHSKALESFRSVLIYDPQSTQVRLRLATEYVKMGSIGEAIRIVQEALQIDGQKSESHLLMGGLLSSLKSYDKAILSYKKALELNPKSTDALMYLGAVYSEKKDHERALQAFEALAKVEDYANPHLAYYYIGRIREDQGSPRYLSAAESAYQKSLQLKPSYLESVLSLSGLYVRQKRTKQAIEVLRNFQRNHGPHTKVADVLASLYLQSDQYDLALEQFAILEADPEEALNVKMKMALIYIDQKKYSEASAQLQGLLRMAPESDKVRFYLAAVHQELKQNEQAIEHFREIPQSSSYYQDSIVQSAYLLKEMGRLKQAREMVLEALKAKESVPAFYAVYASLVEAPSEIAEAAIKLEKAVEQFPDNNQIRFFWGTLLDRNGQKERSLEQMRLVVEKDPSHVQGLNYIAFTMAEMGQDLATAEKYGKRALMLDPQDSFILDTFGWILFKQGKVREAIPYLEKAHRGQPNEPAIAEHLGDAYSKSQLLDKARRLYEKALQFSQDDLKNKELQSKIVSIQNQETVGFRQPASAAGP